MIGVSVPVFWNATLLELLWLAGGLLALPPAIRNLHDAARDEEILEPMRFDPSVHQTHYRMVQSALNGQTLDHWLTVVSACLIVIAGTVGCAAPNPLGGRVTPTLGAITACLLGVSAITAVRAYAALVTRRRLFELAAGRSSVIAAEMRAKAATDLVREDK